MISKALGEYLKTMYILNVRIGEIRVTDIASEMNCTKPSVNKAIKSLKENKLINYETYGKIELTKEGEDLAKKTLETYDIVYIFLKDVLGLSEEDAKIDAEKIKLNLTDNTINKLAKYVYKELNLNELKCNYDIGNTKCLECSRRKLKKTKNLEEKR